MSQAQQTQADAIKPYANEDEFLRDLQGALEKDYGVSMHGVALQDAGRNINAFLRVLM